MIGDKKINMCIGIQLLFSFYQIGAIDVYIDILCDLIYDDDYDILIDNFDLLMKLTFKIF